ncbi:hypothetical protein BCY86_04210 [Pajaroellobacter abortibovis]|uniref:Uncharacterized protein n=1 Tax=Pajaroellobacter abortibovis TaxID=1882918 RepID=A0A1L6MWR4_9BACT|nr:hypothetical protein BCY86_04210 [Pajaroellobacter abortibovis]
MLWLLFITLFLIRRGKQTQLLLQIWTFTIWLEAFVRTEGLIIHIVHPIAAQRELMERICHH